MDYEVIIGLEVHAQLLTKSKIFCGCSTAYGAEPNTHTCPICLGMPGVLPGLNRNVVDYAIMMALAVHCTVAPVSRFARKNYFYPDLPKGYQISQYDMPLARNGWIEFEAKGKKKRVGIRRLHMEEDAGKSLHQMDGTHLDFNRCGIPLIEIVSEPEIGSPDEAVAYLKTLRTMLRYQGICDGNMEEGSLRCDANLSLRPRGETGLGIRTEVKNMNSFKGVHRALDCEIQRQKGILDGGGRIVQETRLWDEASGKTSPMRGKEETGDYRYFPEPDLLPVVIDEDWIERIRQRLPELPDEKKERFMETYGLSSYDAEILTNSRDLADYFESCHRKVGDSKLVANWIINEMLRAQKRDDREIEDCPVGPEDLADLLLLIQGRTISGKMAKDIFQEMYRTGQEAGLFVRRFGGQIGDRDEIEKTVRRVLEEHRGQVDRFREGKVHLFEFFVGQVMKKTRGKANPQITREVLQRALAHGGTGVED